MKAATAAVEGKMSKTLKKMLKKIASKDMHEELAVADAKLGGIIKVFISFNHTIVCYRMLKCRPVRVAIDSSSSQHI